MSWSLDNLTSQQRQEIAATCFRCFGRSRKLHSRIAACERKAIASGETLRISRPSKVVVLTPSASHAEIVRAALNGGKHVVCEKTLTLDPRESLALGRLAEERQRMLFTSYMKRFFPAVQLDLLNVPFLRREHNPVYRDFLAL